MYLTKSVKSNVAPMFESYFEQLNAAVATMAPKYVTAANGTKTDRMFFLNNFKSFHNIERIFFVCGKP